MLKYEAYALTDIGNVRTNNEDNFFVMAYTKRCIYASLYF